MPSIVGIQFKNGGKTYFFSPKDITFAVGDGAIVETTRGLEYGNVVIANKTVDDSQIVGTLKAVVRKASERDCKQYKTNQEKRLNAIEVAKQKIAKHGLNMKLVDAEYTFDGSKVVFSFTSDNRVDFRELVKDLASHLHVRIELRQIGIRDECKMKGGLGPCGRACCCSSYMNDFQRVSIKMAKNQGLSLNPTKISGLCGRLMCCLKFEDEYYAETIKLMPKVGSEIQTPDGKATVESNDLLKRKVTARIVNEQGDGEIRVYNVADLKGFTATAEADSSADIDDEEIKKLEND